MLDGYHIMLRSLDLFSGVGGITHALRGLATPVMYCEKDETCRAVLGKLIREGKLPRAPIDADVSKLSASAVGKIDLIVAGFPCIGFSSGGNREGLDHPGSGLFVQVMRLAKTIRPPLMFFENVDAILGNQDIHVIVKSIRRLGYDMWWVVMPAYAVGAPQNRKRWFCLAVRRGVRDVQLRSSEPFVRFNWAREPARMIPKLTDDARKRYRMLGNSVVPDCVRAAFLSLFTGCTVPVPALLKGTSFRLSPPKPLGVVLQSHSHSYACVVGGSSEWQRIPKPPGMSEPPKLDLVLDPDVYRPPPGYVPHDPTSGLIKKPRRIRMFATLRSSCGFHAMHVLTNRAKSDLGSQLRFERRTPAAMRAGAVNPEFAEWLMGLPRGWTSLPA